MSPNTVRLQEWVHSKLRNSSSSAAATTTFLGVDVDAQTGRPAVTPVDATRLLADALIRCSASHPEEREAIYDCAACSPCMKGCLMWASGNRRRYFLVAPPRAFRHFGTGDCFPPMRAVEDPRSPGSGNEIRAACEVPPRIRSFMYVFTAGMVKECIAREIIDRSQCISHHRRGNVY